MLLLDRLLWLADCDVFKKTGQEFKDDLSFSAVLNDLFSNGGEDKISLLDLISTEIELHGFGSHAQELRKN